MHSCMHMQLLTLLLTPIGAGYLLFLTRLAITHLAPIRPPQLKMEPKL